MNQNNISLETVIEGLECCTQHGSMCGLDCNGHYEYSEPDHERIVLVGNYRESCSYGKCETGCAKTLARDALALLKNLNEKLEETQRAYESALMIAPFYDDYMGW